MRRFKSHIVLFCGALFLLNSCAYVKTLFPKKKKDNYVNYNLLFADPESNNALSKPSASAVPDKNENKIRIITINRITNDTIVEWVDPIEINLSTNKILKANNEGAVSKLPEDGNSSKPLSNQITNQNDLLQTHKAVVFKVNELQEKPTFEKINDTLIVTSDKNSLDAVLIQLASGSLPKAGVLDGQTSKTKSKGNKLKNLLGLKPKEKEVIENTLTTETPKVKIVEVTEAEKIIKPNVLYSNANTLVGDLMFDTDPNALVILDEDTIGMLMPKSLENWKTFKARANVHFKSPKDNQRFATNFRLKRDSITWASINFIAELARAIVSKDSVKAIDKLKDKFYMYDILRIQELIKLPLDFASIQDLLLGKIPNYGFRKSLAKINSKGTAIKLLANGMSAVLVLNTDSTIKNLLILANNSKGSYSIRSSFDNYEETIYGKLSTKREIIIVENKNETKIDLDFNKFSFDEELEYPFTIPKKFKDGVKPTLEDINKN